MVFSIQKNIVWETKSFRCKFNRCWHTKSTRYFSLFSLKKHEQVCWLCVSMSVKFSRSHLGRQFGRFTCCLRLKGAVLSGIFTRMAKPLLLVISQWRWLAHDIGIPIWISCTLRNVIHFFKDFSYNWYFMHSSTFWLPLGFRHAKKTFKIASFSPSIFSKTTRFFKS